MILRVKVNPNARADAIPGWEEVPQAGCILRIRLKAPPVDGMANQALIRFLAKSFKLPTSSVTLLKGASSRLKILELPDNIPLP